MVDLLGVGEGRLIFTTPTGLRAVNVDDGLDAWALPDGGGGLPPAGRGLLIGDVVLWPTASKGPDSAVVYAVRQDDGNQPDDPSLLSRIPAGNLVYADGCLLCAERQTLTIFTPPEMRLEEKDGQSRAASPPDKHALLLEAGQRAGAAKHWDEAAGYFKQAAATEFAAPLRLQALLETAALWKTAGQGDRAAAVRRTIADAKDLAGLMVMDDAGVPRRGRLHSAGI